MSHKFNPANMKKLDNPMRRELLPPEETVLKLGIKPGQTVVDLGCGIGYFTFPLAQTVGPEGNVFGVDISPEMLQECKRRQQEEHSELHNITFLQSEENQIPLENQQVEEGLLCNVLHELPQPEVFLAEVKRILKPLGRLNIIEWKKEKMDMGPPLKERLSVEDTTLILESADFTVVEVLELGKGHYAVIAGFKLIRREGLVWASS